MQVGKGNDPNYMPIAHIQQDSYLQVGASRQDDRGYMQVKGGRQNDTSYMQVANTQPDTYLQVGKAGGGGGDANYIQVKKEPESPPIYAAVRKDGRDRKASRPNFGKEQDNGALQGAPGTQRRPLGDSYFSIGPDDLAGSVCTFLCFFVSHIHTHTHTLSLSLSYIIMYA